MLLLKVLVTNERVDVGTGSSSNSNSFSSLVWPMELTWISSALLVKGEKYLLFYIHFLLKWKVKLSHKVILIRVYLADFLSNVLKYIH